MGGFLLYIFECISILGLMDLFYCNPHKNTLLYSGSGSCAFTGSTLGKHFFIHLVNSLKIWNFKILWRWNSTQACIGLRYHNLVYFNQYGSYNSLRQNLGEMREETRRDGDWNKRRGAHDGNGRSNGHMHLLHKRR